MNANKIYRNEKLFNDLNVKLANRVSELLPSDFPKDIIMDLYCECANKECLERIEIAYNDYITIANDPLTFMVKPDHMFPEFERVLRRTMNYWIVMKKAEKLTKDFEI